ncbi:MAG: hypothetical protein AAB383_00445 [Patescibacteria group bacterium]
MTTDLKTERILDELHKGFKRIDKKIGTLDRKIGKLDGKVTSLDEKVSSLDEKVSSLDLKLNTLDGKLSSVIVEVTSNGRKLDQLVTQKEFGEFKDQTLTHFDGLSKQIEDLQEDRLLLKA